MEPDCSSIEQQADVRSDQDRMSCSQILTIVNYYRMEGRICFELFSLPNLLCNIQQDSIESLIAPLRTKKRTNHPDTLRVTDRVTNSNPFLTA